MKKVLLLGILSVILLAVLRRAQEEKKIADRMHELKRYAVDDEVPLSDWRSRR